MVLAFFGRIARAAAKQGLGDIAAACMDPTGMSAINYFGKVAGEVWRDIRHENKQDKLQAEILEAAILTFEEAKLAGLEAAQEATADPELQGHIERLVTLIPASIRASLRRPEDPTGTTLPKGFEVHDEQDIVKLLPVRLPRFKAGDTPLWLRGWRLVEQIGAGGFGEVWKVQSLGASNLYNAVKFSHNLSETEFSLLNEGDVLNRLLGEDDHEGIVPLRGISAKGDPVPWIMFKYIAGGDLTTQIHRWQTLPANERLDKVTGALTHLAKTVGYFHRLEPKIVHRDLKPSNILVEAKSGNLLIADFGIGAVSSARAIRNERSLSLSQSQGAVIATYLRGSHTPLYASKQQKQGSQLIDPRDDVHALGVIAYQMLTGQLDAAPGADIEEELTDRQTPAWLIALIKRCVSSEPARRPADGIAIVELLKPNPEPVANVAPEEEPVYLEPEPDKTQAVSRSLQAGDRKEIALPGGVKMAFAYCPRGTFMMGSNNGKSDEKPVHEVRLTKGFWMGVTPVTQAQWQAIMGNNPSYFKGAELPVEQVSWDEAVQFCKAVQQKCGIELRLPTEAEWEYACRAGTTTEYYSGNGDAALRQVGWFEGNTGRSTHVAAKVFEFVTGIPGASTRPVSQLKANAWNLHDMHGNVWEWCTDWYDAVYYGGSPDTDPVCQDCEQKYKILRGGSWYHYPTKCRSATRYMDLPFNRMHMFGFRVCSTDT